MKKRLLLTAMVILLLMATMIGCSKEEEKASTVDAEDKKTIKIGTFSSSKIAADSGKEELEKMGYEVEIVVFDDAVLPNTALSEGSIDANIFQHTPYLKAYLESNDKVSLTMLDPLLYYPNYGLYSLKHKSINDIPEGGLIGLYNDASNMDRGLKLLQVAGLIKLTDEKKDLYNKLDIVENPKKLEFVEMAFGTAVRSLDDTDASVSAASHILQADLDPKSALVFDEINDEFSCGMAVRTEDTEADWIKDMMKAYTSDDARTKFEEGYKGASMPLY